MADDLTFRRATPDDTSVLCELIGAVFPDNPKADPAVLRWQFWENPFGDAVCWIAEDEGDAVAHFAVLPVPGTINGRPARLAKPADAATRSTHQGRGLMGQLATKVFADCAAEGIPVTECMPNYRARGALVKVGLHQIGRMRVLVRPVRPGFLTDRFHVPGPLARATTRIVAGTPLPNASSQVSDVPADLDELVDRAAEQGRSGISHRSDWWRWRYVDAPLDYDFWEHRADGRLVGVAVTRVRAAYGGRFLNVLDLVADDDDTARSLIGSAIAAADDPDGVAMLANAGTRIAALGRACGMRPLPARLEPQPVILGYIANDPAHEQPRDDTWTISWCDLDHV